MALRKILTQGDPSLGKVCRPVEKFDRKLHWLLDDLKETLENAGGVGLAAPQIGILRRAVIVMDDQDQMIELVNPEIVKEEGEQRGSEGCLSVPEKVGIVVRPNKVKVKAYDINMKPITVKGEELLARALVHEIEHLDGILYVDRIEGRLYDADEWQEE